MQNCWTQNIFEIQREQCMLMDRMWGVRGRREWKVDDSKIFRLSSYRMGEKIRSLCLNGMCQP